LSKLQIIDSKRMEKTRQKGSHAFYKDHDGRTTTIPHHKGRVLARTLIREILREIEVTADDYNKYLKRL